MIRVSTLLAVLPVTALVALSCRSPTEVTVELSTDVGCGTLDGTSVTTATFDGLEDKPVATLTRNCSDGSAVNRIGSIVITPSQTKNASFAIRAIAGVDRSAEDCQPPNYAGCIVARRALRFVPHTPLNLPIVLRRICKDVICDPTTTCVNAVCVPAEIRDPSACEQPGACEENVLVQEAPCTTTTLDCNGLTSDGCETDITSNPAHCGGCNLACSSSKDACIDSVCTSTAVPVTLTTAASGRLAIDTTHVYFTGYQDPGTVQRIAKTGGAVETIASAEPLPLGVAVDDTFVFWVCDQSSPNGVVRRALKTGGGLTTLASSLGTPVSITLDATYVYWAELERGVRRVAKTGGTPEVLMSAPGARDLAVDSTHVYATTETTPGSVLRAPLGGGSLEVLVSGLDRPFAIALSSSYVYYSTSNFVARVPKAGGVSQTLLTDVERSKGLAVRGETAYATVSFQEFVYRIPPTLLPVTILASQQNGAQGITLDASNAYWVTGDGIVKQPE